MDDTHASSNIVDRLEKTILSDEDVKIVFDAMDKFCQSFDIQDDGGPTLNCAPIIHDIGTSPFRDFLRMLIASDEEVGAAVWLAGVLLEVEKRGFPSELQGRFDRIRRFINLKIGTAIIKAMDEAEKIRESMRADGPDWYTRLEGAAESLRSSPPSLNTLAFLVFAPSPEAVRDILGMRARKGAFSKLENSPKQYAKEQIYKAWIEWREGRAQYGKRNSQAAFASAMREKWDVIESVRSIENWCRDWKNGKNIPLIEPAQ